MTIPASTVPAAVAYLHTNVTTAVNDPAVLVSYGQPGTRQPDDMIVVGDVSREVAPWQMVGSGQAGWLDEIYTINVVVSVFRGGDYAQTVMERACVLADVVVAVIRNDPSLGGAVTVAHPSMVDYRQEWDQEHKGRLVDVTVSVRCRARI